MERFDGSSISDQENIECRNENTKNSFWSERLKVLQWGATGP